MDISSVLLNTLRMIKTFPVRLLALLQDLMKCRSRLASFLNFTYKGVNFQYHFVNLSPFDYYFIFFMSFIFSRYIATSINSLFKTYFHPTFIQHVDLIHLYNWVIFVIWLLDLLQIWMDLMKLPLCIKYV